jgi:signal transduction histidine kinase
MIFEDTTGVLSYKSVTDSNHISDFKYSTQVVPNLGFSKSAFWFKFNLQDSSSRQREWVLDIAMPSLHEVDFFISSSDSLLESVRTGFIMSRQQKSIPYRNPAIEFECFPGKYYTIYARIKSETPIIAPIFLREKKNYIGYDRTREFLLGLYFGILLVMALYHFFLHLSTSDRAYLWQALFITCFGLGQMTAVYGFLADWGISGIGSHLRWLHVINYLAAIFAIKFSCSIVLSKKFTPRSNLVLNSLQIVTVVFIPLSLFMSFGLAENLLLVLNIVPLPFFLYSAITAYRNGHRPALYYLFAASSFIAGLAIYNLMYGFDLFPFNTFTYFLPNLTFVITLVLFSIGLADMINTYKHERDRARERALADLNEKLHLQEEKTNIERELEKSRKMETIGRLLRGVAHDMSNLLHPILGYAVLLRKECKSDARLLRQADNLVSSTERLKELSLTLVNASRAEPMGNSVIDLNKTVGQIGSLLKHSCPKNISITFNPSKDNLTIVADAGLLNGAILNVGINAIDAMPGGGSVTISAGNVILDQAHPVRQKFNVAEGPYATVSISDTSTSMASQVPDQLFESSKATKEGGLGTRNVFPGVYNCMKAHNGCMDVYNESGIGNGITMFFPMGRTGS